MLLAYRKYDNLFNMSEIDEKRRSDCPISFGLDIFGDKWTLLILRDIMFYNRTRFSDFAPREGIATNILADRLNILMRAGLIQKQRDEKLKNQYIYSATRKGQELLPALIELTLWGFQYDAKTPASRAFVKRLQTDKQKVVREIARAVKRNTFLRYRQDNIFSGITES